MKLNYLIGSLATAGVVAAGLTACGGGSTSSSTVSLSGTVSAPNGDIAFNDSTNFLTRLARLFVSEAMAIASSGTFTGVGAGVTVELIEIDSTGAKVGSTLASATTDSTGSYSLTAPSGFVPASKYVVRATGSSGTIDAIVTGTTVDVDPVTNVAKTLILASSPDLATISTSEVAAITNEVQNLANDTSLGYTSSSDATTQLTTLANKSEELSNVVASTAAAGTISGKVIDSAGNPLANIKVVVRDFGNWVTRSVAWTDASGNYVLNVPAGDYILGAINGTTASTAASEWWTADNGAGAINQFSAAKVTVGGTAVTGNFQLKNGVRISGNVTGTGTALGGINVKVNDFTNDQPVTTSLTKADGSYTLNVRPGSYALSAVNQTSGLPFATSYYGASGTMVPTASASSPIIAATGTPITADFALPAGTLVFGVVKDAPAGTLQTGAAVRFYATTLTDSTGAYAQATRTDLAGSYRFWLPTSGTFAVRSRGQTANLSPAGTAIPQDFTAQVAAITGSLKDVSNNPVSQVKVEVYWFDGTQYQYLGHETSSSDGTFTTYTDGTNNDVKISFKVDSGASIGSQVYNGLTAFGAGTDISNQVSGNTSTPTSVGSVTLPTGYPLSGTIATNVNPKGNYVVQVRSGGTDGVANRFVNTRTQSDGSYSVSLPAGDYKVRACPAGVTANTGSGLSSSSCSAFSSITVSAASTKNF